MGEKSRLLSRGNGASCAVTISYPGSGTKNQEKPTPTESVRFLYWIHPILNARTPSAKHCLASRIGGAQMKNLKMRLGLVALLVCASLLLMGAAQDTQDTTKTTRYVTGCLQNGHAANEYDLTAENAKWHVKSDNVRLADHVGHKVKVAGVVSNQPFHGMKEDVKAEVEKNPMETGALIVTNLEMVSESCN
jgi:hypothetical protein